MRAHIAVPVLPLVAATSARAQDTRRSAPLKRAASSTDVPATLPLKFVGPPTIGAITPLDLMTRLYKFADDSMMGRLAGTPWNDKGTDYIAAELARLGLQPAGENGTYFQSPLVQRAVAPASGVALGARQLELWKDWAPRDQGLGARAFDG